MHMLPLTPVLSEHVGPVWAQQAVHWMQNNQCGYSKTAPGNEDWWGYLVSYALRCCMVGIPGELRTAVLHSGDTW